MVCGSSAGYCSAAESRGGEPGGSILYSVLPGAGGVIVMGSLLSLFPHLDLATCNCWELYLMPEVGPHGDVLKEGDSVQLLGGRGPSRAKLPASSWTMVSSKNMGMLYH